MSTRAILIFGATGKQGGAVLAKLQQDNKDAEASKRELPFDLYAVSRNASSSKSQALSKLAGVSVIQGNMDNVGPIFEEAAQRAGHNGLYGVFSVQDAGANEVAQGKSIADHAAKHQVKLLVYSSVEMGGLEDTKVPHFETKRVIEKYTQQTYPELALTILHPVAFMENFNYCQSTFQGKIFSTMLTRDVKRELKYVAVADVGHFAALAFETPEKYKNRTLPLAGDSLTPDQIRTIFKETKGTELPTTYRIVTWLLLSLVGDLRKMVYLFNTQGYKVNIDELRKEYPELKTFKQFLETDYEA
ncbi:uncharacterized protein L969DRAFT_81109 [Mixia osmundae IAM 14324]|uniref:NmrA-like domain-containing protein n=1 Tax=Mixia osmundae (strain CBS 9802 / IAM 14324 / JCM 22182 / KY 12970) TaxID=764103 RepID=G7E7B8_MIXOS|nr:uncharacterized protein L969DRAFT_81109 [Mixia osmundae IAM 14324]KEI42696.1 hypothetical protein L969DRAFT_81109 [Mixia osmundae IAM 14324]GAA98728.1 hypothetical protein E5Q_05416 [Mixia osmundae IAM 14324]